jgi:hypothetical protein
MQLNQIHLDKHHSLSATITVSVSQDNRLMQLNQIRLDKHQHYLGFRLHQYQGPLNSFKPATSGHASSLSYIPSPSVSFQESKTCCMLKIDGASGVPLASSLSPKDFL